MVTKSHTYSNNLQLKTASLFKYVGPSVATRSRFNFCPIKQKKAKFKYLSKITLCFLSLLKYLKVHFHMFLVFNSKFESFAKHNGRICVKVL